MNRNTKMRGALVTCMLLLVVPVFLGICGFLLPPQYENTFLGELKYKCQALLEPSEKKRIIIVGGSGVAFGVDSALLEEQLPDYEVINFGMYAALGTTVMLDLSVDDIRPGDIVILSPEQERQTLSEYFNAEAMWQALDGDFSLLTKIAKDDRGKLAGQFPYFAVHKFKYYVNQNAPDPQGVYSRRSFNDYGDLVSEECNANRMAAQFDSNTPVLLTKDLPEEAFIEAVNAYTDELTARGATVWYRFCPMNELAVKAGLAEEISNKEIVQEVKEAEGTLPQEAERITRAQIDFRVEKYSQILQEKLHCYIIGDPKNAVMESGWFYDTNFHLNSSGKVVNTCQLIKDIKAMLGDSSVTTVELPDMPIAENELQLTGNNEDAELFLYSFIDSHEETMAKTARSAETADVNKRLSIVGLTDEGKTRDKLTVPVEYNGNPVTEISENAFQESKHLSKILIQENIRFIENGAFDGCVHLEEIRLLQRYPELCQVGQELLRGTNAKILVDEEVVSEYKVNYFWSVYGEKIEY